MPEPPPLSVYVQDCTWLEQRVHVVHQGLLESAAAAHLVVLHLMIILPEEATPEFQR